MAGRYDGTVMHDDSHRGRTSVGAGFELAESSAAGAVAAPGGGTLPAGNGLHASLPDAIAAVEPLALRRAMGRFATGVAVVTALDGAGQPVGITVNSLTSVSLDPPLLLWSIDRRSTSWPTFRDSASFAVNVLASDGGALCRRFSRRESDRFAGVQWRRGPLGLPLLHGSLSQLACRVWARYPGGDHEIIVGEVLSAEGRDGEPLLFHQGRLAPDVP